MIPNRLVADDEREVLAPVLEADENPDVEMPEVEPAVAADHEEARAVENTRFGLVARRTLDAVTGFAIYVYTPVHNYVVSPLYYGFITFPYNNIATPIYNALFVRAVPAPAAPVAEEAAAPAVEGDAAPVVEEAPQAAPVVEEAAAPVLEGDAAPAVEEAVAPRTWFGFARDMVTNYAYNPAHNYVLAPLYYGFVTFPYNNIATPIYNALFVRAVPAPAAPVVEEAAAPAVEGDAAPVVEEAPQAAPVVDGADVAPAVEEAVAPRTWFGFAHDMVTNYAYNPAHNYVLAPLYYGFVTAPYNNIVAPVVNLFASRVVRHFSNNPELMNRYDAVVRNIRDHQVELRAVAGKKSHLKAFAEKIEKNLSDVTLPEDQRNWTAVEAATLATATWAELYHMKQELLSYQLVADSMRESALEIRELVAENSGVSPAYQSKLTSLYAHEYQEQRRSQRAADLIIGNIGPKKGWLNGFNSSVFDRVQPNDPVREDNSLEGAKLFAKARVVQFTQNVSGTLRNKCTALSRRR